MPPEVAQWFQLGGTALWFIGGGSVIVTALAFEQLYTHFRLVDSARSLGTEVQKSLLRSDLAAARSACERSASPVADIFLAALNRMNRPGESVVRAAERERVRVGLWLKRRLWALGTLGAIAPFVGLFGTVIGIIRAFHDIAQAGNGGFSVVASGVSEALQATAGGIFVAIAAVIFYNYFQARANRAIVEIRLVTDEFLEQLGLMEIRPAPAEISRGAP
ncbi:MAG: MotA/TolQ/ExbB proton channel family protein [Deltaproteobacteria bacterium]|nr:MotA/TolQ/ExbB proton channel family protein [Deltaproteobacteria bacterium]